MAELKMNFTKAAESFEKTAKERGLFVGWWIPVTERLPEEDGRYYVTRHDDATQTDFTDILWYEKVCGGIDNQPEIMQLQHGCLYLNHTRQKGAIRNEKNYCHYVSNC